MLMLIISCVGSYDASTAHLALGQFCTSQIILTYNVKFLLLLLQSVQSYERIVLFRLGLLLASRGPGMFNRIGLSILCAI